MQKTRMQKIQKGVFQKACITLIKSRMTLTILNQTKMIQKDVR